MALTKVTLSGASDRSRIKSLLMGINNMIDDLAAATFDFDGQNLTGVGTIECSEITISGGYVKADEDYGIVLSSYSAGRNHIWALSSSYPDVGMSYYEGTPDYIHLHPHSVTPGGNSGLKIVGDGNVDIPAHDASTVGLRLGGTLVTASAAELNLNDGASYGANDSGGVGFRAIKVANL